MILAFPLSLLVLLLLCLMFNKCQSLRYAEKNIQVKIFCRTGRGQFIYIFSSTKRLLSIDNQKQSLFCLMKIFFTVNQQSYKPSILIASKNYTQYGLKVLYLKILRIRIEKSYRHSREKFDTVEDTLNCKLLKRQSLS